MDFPYGVMVTLRSNVTTTDDNGDSTTVPTETSWGPCAVAPRYATEQTNPHAPAVIVGRVIYGPPVTINADDQLVIDGVTYDVDGEAGNWLSPFTGWNPGVEVAIKRAGAV